MNKEYLDQVALLLRILPEVSRISAFALHGGTAINLFYHNMPRLSVDIDLTYVPFGDRKSDLENISRLLDELTARLQRTIPGISVRKGRSDGEQVKLFCRLNDSEVKIEVNTINRGLIGSPTNMELCIAAQHEFGVWCKVSVVSYEQLFGGKIVAALDRQHPRDLFDVRILLDNRLMDERLLIGFLFFLFSSKRPLDEILNPHHIDFDHLIKNQFTGMTKEEFTVENYRCVLDNLLNSIHSSLSANQKTMIITFAETKPIWLYGDWSKYPGIAWKLKNLNLLKEVDPAKFKSQIEKIKAILG